MEWGYRAVMAISPETAPGIKKLKVEYSIGGAVRKEEFSFQVQSGDFLFSRRALDLGNYSDVDYRLKPEELRFIEACTGKKKKVFGTKSPDRLRASFSHPRDAHHITSPFWAKRLIMRYRKNNGKKVRFPDKINVHKGIDLRGRAGDPVYAMAGGTVAIAEPMYYEGNFVVIDHGHRMFSLYMHLGKIAVKEGASVRAGDRIGSVGSTGLSTAPHLHVSLMIQDVYVDPMSILSLPLRD
ncbi:MAG: M23 family metallopeptidase [Spirochaetes bacterium]|nr:M23 family metallopeptidase [Spirochaetota bacterium]